jgi:hypothetical protein
LEVAMGFKTVLVPTARHDLMNSTLETALTLARRFDSYIEGFALSVALPAAVAMGDVSALPIPKLELEENERRAEACSRISCETIMCRLEVTQKSCQAIG